MIGLDLNTVSSLTNITYNDQSILVSTQEITKDHVLFDLFDNRLLETQEFIDISKYDYVVKLAIVNRKLDKNHTGRTEDELDNMLAKLYPAGYTQSRVTIPTADIVTKRATIISRDFEDTIRFVERQFRIYIKTTVGEIPFSQGFGSHIQEYLHTKYTDAAKDLFVAEIKEFAESLNMIYSSFELMVSNVVVTKQQNIAVLDVNMNIDITLSIVTNTDNITTTIRIS